MIRVTLKVLSGVNAGKELVIPQKQFLIGRGNECQLKPKSDAISRHHCAILISETQVGVRDFGSKNGTYVNDERVQEFRSITPGDRLRVGPLEFALMFEFPAGKPQRAAPQNAKEVAARTANNSDDAWDVGSWLNDADDDVSVAEPETRQFRLDETDRVKIEAASSDETQMEVVDSADTETVAEEPKKKGPQKLPPRNHKTEEDSRSAADVALKRYFSRG